MKVAEEAEVAMPKSSNAAAQKRRAGKRKEAHEEFPGKVYRVPKRMVCLLETKPKSRKNGPEKA